jgi:hypothetical protein
MLRSIRDRLGDETAALVDEYRREPDSRISQLAKRLGVSIRLEDLDLSDSGYLDHNPECGSPSGYEIVVNKRHPVTRQRWTTAHELGHFLLHRGDEDVFPTSPIKHRSSFEFYFEDEDKEEAEANQFAADVLIPMSLLHRAYDRGHRDASKLAEIFNVSTDAMELRMKRYFRYREKVSR